jgi:hypothetical protein
MDSGRPGIPLCPSPDRVETTAVRDSDTAGVVSLKSLKKLHRVRPSKARPSASWGRYSDGPYQGSDQGRLYKEAFGPNVSRIAPRLGVIR